MSYYSQLTQLFQRLSRLDHLAAINGWDMQTMMPAGGSQARSQALAELGVIHHELLTQPRTADLLDEASNEQLDPDQHANLREMARQYRLAAQLPARLVEAKALAGGRCEQAWRVQRGANDWSGFAVNLQQVVALSREEAQIRAAHGHSSPYDALLDIYEPGMTSSKLDDLFSDLNSWLPSLLQEVMAHQAQQPQVSLTGAYPVAQQKALAKEVMQMLGFDFNHGRLDVSAHPFCGGVPQDVRITTRYTDSEFLSALMGVIHETGHARYEQNLPSQWADQPIGLARSTAIHESQSLFMEMQLARSSEFLQQLHPLICRQLPAAQHLPFEQLVRAVQEVRPGFIRVDADEVSYPAHIILRYDIEKALINGEIEVADIPELWDQRMFSLLGLRTAGNYRQGCMQDIHWTDGSFGYFPTYTLGAMYAAQLFQARLAQVPALRQQITAGELTPTFEWLKRQIWSQASRHSSQQLLIQATGEDLNPHWFKQHLTQRYLPN